MEKIEVNTNTIFSKYKIKKTILDLFLSIVLLGIVLTLSYFDFKAITYFLNNSIDNASFYYALFLTLFIILILGILSIIALIVYLVVVIIKHIRIINYYKEARFIFRQTINFEFDYKLWQTAKKHSFHSQVLRIKLDDEIIEKKSRVIFTNHERIGLFKIPLELQSHTYKKEKYEVAYDKIKDEIVVIDI
ncbi:MAG: hypothetical protein K6B64_02330 [Acholeplasmatales bacterium]|nr:hypothetical protein [Acholeplasmatales bacterium]